MAHSDSPTTTDADCSQTPRTFVRVTVTLTGLIAVATTLGLNPVLAAAAVATGLAVACAVVLAVTTTPGQEVRR